MSAETTTTLATRPTAHGVAEKRGLFDREILGRATIDAVRKLDPRGRRSAIPSCSSS